MEYDRKTEKKGKLTIFSYSSSDYHKNNTYKVFSRLNKVSHCPFSVHLKYNLYEPGGRMRQRR